jgi:hypothetical protein
MIEEIEVEELRRMEVRPAREPLEVVLEEIPGACR